MQDIEATNKAGRRLSILQSLQLADDEPYRALDLIAEAALHAATADAGYVVFFEDERTWVKAAAGAAPRDVARLELFAAHVVGVAEARSEAGARPQGCVRSHDEVGAYCGAPLFVQGHVVGMLCVASATPRTFLPQEIAQIAALAEILADRLEARRDKLFLSQLFDGTSDAVLVVDERQTILHWNAAAAQIFGYPASEALGRPLGMIIPEHLRSQHDRGFARICNGGLPTLHGAVEVDALRRDGGVFPASLALSTWRSSDGMMVGAIVRDISDRAALAQARLASEAKTRFLANMSHEIRTPLNGVLGLGDVLSRTPLTSSQAEILRSMTGAARTLEALLGDVLDLARLEEGALPIVQEPFELSGLLHEVVQLHRPAAEAKGLSYALRGPPDEIWVSGDPVRLKQVLGNLLSNGVKFTQDGFVHLEVERRGEAWRFDVVDTGVGFDDHAKAKIFERFAQADDSITRRFGGSGLGLSICLDLVRALGGRLDAESTPGGGSRFTLELTLPCVEHPSPVEELRVAGQGLRVLLAEDHPVNRKVVELILAEVGAQLTSVPDGAEATRAYELGDFDVILMDMQMPVVDGLTATRAIRAFEQAAVLRRCPIIMLTANVMPEHAAASREAGADAHVGKPIEAASLLKAIDEVLRSASVVAGAEGPLVSAVAAGGAD